MTTGPRIVLPFLDGPRLSHPVTLRMQGDWGFANIHAICGWLGQEFADRAPLGTRTAIWNGRGGADGIAALKAGEVDIAVVTPSEFAYMAYLGVGPHEGDPQPWLRALGRIPQDDRLIFGVDKALGFTTFAQIREARPALRIATSPNDGVNWIGYAAAKALELCGIGPAEFKAWGWSFIEAERPPDCARLVAEGQADAILHEGISGPWWPDLERVRPLSYIPFEADGMARAAETMAWTSDPVPAGLFPAEVDFDALNFDDFTILVRDDMADDVADLLAWCIVSKHGALEARYRHIPTARSPINHPMAPAQMIDTLVPLHAAAAARYRDLGIA